MLQCNYCISDENPQSYGAILHKLSKDWMSTEMHHDISKSASDALWQVALKWFHPLIVAKERENVRKNVPQFVHIRRTLTKKKSPAISMKIAYEEKETGRVSIANSESTPSSQFPKSTHKKIFEIASVKVCMQKTY